MRFTRTRRTPPFNPAVNRASERTSIPGLVHTVLTQRKLTGRRQRTASNDGHDTISQHLQGTQPFNFNARRMHIQVGARHLTDELIRTQESKTDRMSDHVAPQETPSRGTQGAFSRTAPSKSQLNRARMSAMAQSAQDGRLVFFAREPPNREDPNEARFPHLTTITTHRPIERHTV